MKAFDEDEIRKLLEGDNKTGVYITKIIKKSQN